MKLKKRIFRCNLWLCLVALLLQSGGLGVVYAEPAEEVGASEAASDSSEAESGVTLPELSQAQTDAEISEIIESPAAFSEVEPSVTEENPPEVETGESVLWEKHLDQENPTPSIKSEKVTGQAGVVAIEGDLFAGKLNAGSTSQTLVDSFQIEIKNEEGTWEVISSQFDGEKDGKISEKPYHYKIVTTWELPEIEIRYQITGRKITSVDGEEIATPLNGYLLSNCSVENGEVELPENDSPAEEGEHPEIVTPSLPTPSENQDDEENLEDPESLLETDPLLDLLGGPQLRDGNSITYTEEVVRTNDKITFKINVNYPSNTAYYTGKIMASISTTEGTIYGTVKTINQNNRDSVYTVEFAAGQMGQGTLQGIDTDQMYHYRISLTPKMGSNTLETVDKYGFVSGVKSSEVFSGFSASIVKFSVRLGSSGNPSSPNVPDYYRNAPVNVIDKKVYYTGTDGKKREAAVFKENTYIIGKNQVDKNTGTTSKFEKYYVDYYVLIPFGNRDLTTNGKTTAYMELSTQYNVSGNTFSEKITSKAVTLNTPQVSGLKKLSISDITQDAAKFTYEMKDEKLEKRPYVQELEIWLHKPGGNNLQIIEKWRIPKEELKTSDTVDIPHNVNALDVGTRYVLVANLINKLAPDAAKETELKGISADWENFVGVKAWSSGAVYFLTKSNQLQLIDVPEKFDFGATNVVSDNEQTLSLAEDSYTTDEVTAGFNVRIFEDRAKADGWKLNVTCSPLMSETSSDDLAGAKITFDTKLKYIKNYGNDDVEVIVADDGTITTTPKEQIVDPDADAPEFDSGIVDAVTHQATLLTDGVSKSFLNSEVGKGAGAWDVQVAFDSVKLVVPGGKGKAGHKFKGKITWTLDDTL